MGGPSGNGYGVPRKKYFVRMIGGPEVGRGKEQMFRLTGD